MSKMKAVEISTCFRPSTAWLVPEELCWTKQEDVRSYMELGTA
jgi:hypothetical protein